MKPTSRAAPSASARAHAVPTPADLAAATSVDAAPDLAAVRVATPPGSPVEVAPCFGAHPDHAWSWTGDRLSLVRRAPSPRPLSFEAQPQALTVDLARSALVVIDMQNDFCHPRGWFGQKGVKVAPMRRPIPVLKRLLPAWRAAGAPVIWVNWGVRPDRANLPPTVLFKGKRSSSGRHDGVGYAQCSPEDRGRSLVPGEWGAAVVDELAVAPGDFTVFKHRLSGFFDNELDSLLRQQGITTLFYTGVNTDRCVFSTLQDAGFLGYDNVLLADACSTLSPGYVSRAIHYLVQQLHGFVARTDALLPALSSLSSLSTSTPKESSR